jgi:hypothetical protein
VLAFALAVLPVLPARAHTSDPTIVARIDAVEPPLPGVTVEVRTGVADQLLLVNTTDTPVEVLGTNGRPFLRIAKDEVTADVSSPDWVPSNSPLGQGSPVSGPPDWRVVAKGGSWGWFDHRMHAVPRPLTPELVAARRVVRLADWTVPLRQGATRATVRGHVEYRPVLGAFRSRVTSTPDGLTVDVLDGRVPGLFARWTGRGTLTLRGIAGEPFARFGPAVEVNEASETWQESQRLQGKPTTGVVDPATPRWSRRDETLTWLDRRLAYAPGVVPDDIADRETTLVEWDVAGDVEGREVHVRGTTTWVPSDPPKRRDTRALWLLGAVAVVVAAGLVVLRRTQGHQTSLSKPQP